MNKHAVGIRELAELLDSSPPTGRDNPALPITVHLHFDSPESWRAAVDQYEAVVRYENQDGEGHYGAVVRFGGAELHLAHVAETE